MIYLYVTQTGRIAMACRCGWEHHPTVTTMDALNAETSEHLWFNHEGPEPAHRRQGIQYGDGNTQTNHF